MRWRFGRQLRQPRPTAQATPPVIGFYRCRENLVSGWIIDSEDPKRKHDVEVFVHGKSIGTARADRYDALVQDQHGGDGTYAFALFYGGDPKDGSIEATVVDCATHTPLRSKLPYIQPSRRSGPPLLIHSIRIGKSVELLGRVGAYPWIDASLELWSDGRRVVSAIPIVGSETDGTFSASLEGEALQRVLEGGVDLALPGLQESGLAVRMHKPLVAAELTPAGDDKLRLELHGDFEQTSSIEAVLRFVTSDAKVEEPIPMVSNVATIRIPAGFDLSEGSCEVVIAGVAIPARLKWPLLRDPQFRGLDTDSSAWSVSDNAELATGFFAFPPSLASEHELSGFTAQVSRGTANGPLRLSQVLVALGPKQREASIALLARAAENSKLSARIRDALGVLSECSVDVRTSEFWNLLRLDLDFERDAAGEVLFEVEAEGPAANDLEVTLGGSRSIHEPKRGAISANLLVNSDMHEWPQGAGVLQHSQGGEPCAGWRLTNRRCSEFVFTRAVTDPIDGTLGLALAAPHIKHYLRLEAEVGAADLRGRALLLRFRAGATAAAKRLLSQATVAAPEFTVIDPIQLIRRVAITTPAGFEEREEIAAIFARKVAVSQQLETFEFRLPPLPETPDDLPDDATQIYEIYRIAFEFRGQAVIALFDVELLARDPDLPRDEPAPLRLEDRNVQLQIDTLKTATHWRGPTPVRLADQPADAVEPLKWGAGPVREPVTVVIPVFNALEETLGCLDSLNGTTTVPLLASVIDDASDAPVREALVAYAADKPWIRIHSFAQNRGYTSAADYGIRDARTEWVVLLNSDTVVTRGWLEGMLACARSLPDIAFVGPVSNAASYQSVPELYDATGKWKLNQLPSGVTPEDMASIVRQVSAREYPLVPLLNGFCTLMKRSAFIELGGLNVTAFPQGYGEENDLCLRAIKAGLKLAVADDVYVYHVKSASFGGMRRKELSKNGDAALKKLHPEIDIAALTGSLRETPTLVALRRSVAAQLEKVQELATAELGSAAKLKAPRKKPSRGGKLQLQKA